jgi:hypothetical protein
MAKCRQMVRFCTIFPRVEMKPLGASSVIFGFEAILVDLQ